MKFNEDSRVKIPSILHLIKLGYSYLSLKESSWDLETNIFTDIFYTQLKKNYSLSAGQYFEVRIEYIDISADEFATKINSFENNLESLFAESKTLEKEIQTNLKSLKYE